MWCAYGYHHTSTTPTMLITVKCINGIVLNEIFLIIDITRGDEFYFIFFVLFTVALRMRRNFLCKQFDWYTTYKHWTRNQLIHIATFPIKLFEDEILKNKKSSFYVCPLLFGSVKKNDVWCLKKSFSFYFHVDQKEKLKRI